MKILILTQVYYPEIDPTAVMVRELSQFLSNKGWDVNVITGYPQRPFGSIYPGYKNKIITREKDGKVNVLRTWHLITKRREIPLRFAMSLSKAVGSTWGALLTNSADIVLIYGPPIVGPILGWIVAKKSSSKLVNVILDIYPDAAIDTGRVRNKMIIYAARIAEQLQYRITDLTIVLSEGFKKTLIKRSVPKSKVSVVPVWLDSEEIKPLSRNNDWRKEQEIPAQKKIVLYAGTIGIVSGAAIVVEAARILKKRKDILFLFIGEGEAKKEVESGTKLHRLKNIKIMSFQPRKRLSEVQATADISLVTMAPGCGKIAVPSKVIAYMAAGRPIIGSVDIDSDTAKQISNGNAGLICEPGNYLALARAIEKLVDNSELRSELGKNARIAFENNYSKEKVLKTYYTYLHNIIKK